MHDHCTGHERADDERLEFGEDGELVDHATAVLRRPCPVSALDGSWLLEVEPRTAFGPLVRGPLRIEVGASSLRASGDIYTRRRLLPVEPPLLAPDVAFVAPVADDDEPDDGDDGDDGVMDDAEDHVVAPTSRPWYPVFPKSQYAWYLRSTGATYTRGTLTISITRHVWNRATQEFVSTDTGRLVLTCLRSLRAVPFRPAQMRGTLTIGGSTSTVTATKTSRFYRGCRVEVDVMVNRRFPASATIGSGAAVTLRSVYATAGWDVRVVQDQVDVPDDASLTNAELQTLLAAHRQAASGEEWRLWLLVGSAQGGLFGIMFDDDTVPREGAVGFADARLGNSAVIAADARNRPLNDVPAAFLRTLVHEAGHAFNLFHPKHDIHQPAIGREIMNQTGDVISFATAADPYPGNARFVFADHDRTSLIHSPDPQVRPGWKNFGWGHGSLSAGLPEPVDVAGLSTADGDDGLALAVRLPSQAFVGEYVTAEVELTNTGPVARDVTSLLTLAEGDLVFLRTAPDGSLDHVLDITIGCGPRPLVTLEPGQSVTNRVQVFFTNQGLTFTTPGRHTVIAQLEADAVTTVLSAPVTIDVRTPANDEEVSIATRTLTHGVGKAMALGDFGSDDGARAVLTELAEHHADTDTGAAGALVMANSLARRFTDFRSDTTRDAAPDDAAHFLELAVRGRTATRAVELAVTVASPTEKEAPVVADTLAQARRARPKSRAKASTGDLAAAERVAEDFVQPQAR